MHIAGSWRTQYVAAPGQAAFVAVALALLGSLLPGRAGQWLVVGTTGILAANATASSLHSQDLADTPIRFEKTAHVFRQVHGLSPRLAADTLVLFVRFEKTAHIFRQVHGLSPRLAADTLVLFVLDDGAITPLGFNYHVCVLGEIVLGVPAVQANFVDPLGNRPVFGPEVVESGCPGDERVYPYERLVAFHLSVDGTVRLLSRLPSSLVPWNRAAERYRPLDRLIPGPIDESRYLRYPSWSAPPLDVLDTEGGVLLGANWSPLEYRGGAFRRADRDAELVVNPLGRARREIVLDAEPAGDLAGQPGDLLVLDERGSVVASARLGGSRKRVLLLLPLEPDRLAVFRLRIEPVDRPDSWDPGGGYLRVWISDGETRAGRRAQAPMEIVGDDARLRMSRLPPWPGRVRDESWS